MLMGLAYSDDMSIAALAGTKSLAAWRRRFKIIFDSEKHNFVWLMDCNSLPIPEEAESYQFPYPPYDIQLQFMKDLFHVIEQGKVGIFESPTGTVRVACRLEIAWTQRLIEQLSPESSLLNIHVSIGKITISIMWRFDLA